MTMWYEVQWSGTYRVWFSPPNPEDVSGVVSQVAMDKTYAKILEMITLWGTRYNRSMTMDELEAMWSEKPIKSNFKVRDKMGGWQYFHEIADEFRRFRREIVDIYREELERDPTHEEIDYTFAGCRNTERSYQKFEWQDEMLALCDQKIKIDYCLVCGEPIYADPHILDYAGEISINFGYGSLRDLDYGHGYVHDVCSAVLDQELLKYRFQWDNCLGGRPSHFRYDIEKSKEAGKLTHPDPPPPRPEGEDVFQRLFDESEIDHDRNDNETKDET